MASLINLKGGAIAGISFARPGRMLFGMRLDGLEELEWQDQGLHIPVWMALGPSPS